MKIKKMIKTLEQLENMLKKIEILEKENKALKAELDGLNKYLDELILGNLIEKWNKEGGKNETKR